ncbi:MAG: outer membrane protein assembly factor YaeT precursor [Acidobacteria bacterium]|nr:outer membrane protein assembly factor YaeT precursor [Acidobacteriota bacterium]
MPDATITQRAILLLLLAILATAASAQTPAPPAAASTETPGVAFTGFIDLAATWNPNRPASGENFFAGAGTTAKRANELSLNLAQLQWTRPVSAAQPVGFTLALVAGEGADVVHASEPSGVARYVYQASVAYRLANGVVLEAGIYPSHIGLEGFYSKDNWNDTRSIMGEASPYYQTGVKASYAWSEQWSGRVDLLNGWQNIRDNNGGKSIGTQLAYGSDVLSASLNTFLGPELAGDDRSARRFADLVVLAKARPRLQLGATADVGAQAIPHADAAQWYGVGLLARYAPDTRQAVAIRAEHFSDPDAGITGAAQTVREATVTYELRPRANVILKIEGRYDRSNADVFAKRDSMTDRQLLAVAGVVVTF